MNQKDARLTVEGRVALISGGAGGMGLAVARCFTAAGALAEREIGRAKLGSLAEGARLASEQLC